MLTSVFLAAVLSVAPRVASPEWATVKVDRELANFFAEELARALRDNGVPVVTAAEISTVLGLERQKALLGCSDEKASCLAELGNALGCDGTLLVNVALLDGSYQANIKVLSTRDGSTLVETAVHSDSSKGFVHELAAAGERIATGLARRSPATARQRAWIPAIAGAAVAAGGAACLGLASARASALDAELAARAQVTPAALQLATEGKTLQTVGWVGAGVGVAALLGAGAMFLFGGEPAVAPQVSVTPTGASIGVTVVLP